MSPRTPIAGTSATTETAGCPLSPARVGEEFLPGREFTVGMGNRNPIVFVMEINFDAIPMDYAWSTW